MANLAPVSIPGLIKCVEISMRAVSEKDEAVAQYITGNRDALLRLIREIQANPPRNSREMAGFCRAAEKILGPIREEVWEARIEVRNFIRNAQRQQKQWQGLRWETREQAINNVREVLTAYLGLPEATPTKGTPEWKKIRGEIQELKSRKDMALAELMSGYNGEGKFFSSHLELLERVFGEYEINNFQRYRKELPMDENLQRVRHLLEEKFEIPNVVPVRYSAEWEQIRKRILEIERKDVKVLQKKVVLHYPDLLIHFFGEDYDITNDDLFGKRGQWKTKEQAIRTTRKILKEKLNLPTCFPEKGTPQWCALRMRVIDLRSNKIPALFNGGKILAWNVAVALAFPELELRAWHISGLGRCVMKVATSPMASSDLINPEDLFLIEGVLKRETRALESLARKIKETPTYETEFIRIDEMRNAVFERLIHEIDIMKTECPISLHPLILMAFSIERKTAFLRFIQRKEIVYVSERDDLNSLEDAHVADPEDVFEMLLKDLSAHEISLIENFRRGKINIDDEILAPILQKMRSNFRRNE